MKSQAIMNKKDDNFENLKEKFQEAFHEIPLNFTMPQNDEKNDASESDTSKEIMESIARFNLKPREVRDFLDRYVIQQHEAKKVLSVAICDHYNHVRRCLENAKNLEQNYHKQNVLILGPTGVGKTYLIRTIAKRIGVPFVKADATKFSETGYVGGDVEDLVRDLVKAANGDVELAQYGIIYIDEIDKIAMAPSSQGRDVSGRGVQINLLKLMEDADVNLITPTDMMGQIQAVMNLQRGGKKAQKQSINTRHILFIFSGAFDKLSEIVKHRVEQTTIGFAAGNPVFDTGKYLHQASTQDFIKYGFEPEFIGRIPIRVACDNLTAQDLSCILRESEGSILRQYEEDFKGYNIDMHITREAIEEVATLAVQEKTGARGLMTILERLFRNFKFELPSSGISFFEIDTETLKDKDKALKQLLLSNQPLLNKTKVEAIHAFEESFEHNHNLKIKFTEQAIKQLIEQSIEQDKTIEAICEQKFKDLSYALEIIAKNRKQSQFVLDVDLLQDTQKVLSQWIVSSFDKKE